MDIPFKVEALETEEAKTESGSRDRLICSNCSFPLAVNSGATSKVCCPRCNTWMDIDPACFGSCLKCHKTQQSQPSSCVEPSLAKLKEENEISCRTAGRKSHGDILKKFSFLVEKARDYLIGKVFL
jgi:transcription initiation factor IIE alpha subunit